MDRTPLTTDGVTPSDLEMKRLRRAEQLPLTGSWTVDHPTRRMSWSRSMYTIFGVAPATFDPTFENAAAALLPEDRRHLIRQARLWGAHGGPFGVVVRLLRPDGSVRLLELRGWTEIEAGNGVRRSMGTGRDVTEELAVAREHERLAQQRMAIIAAAAEGLCGLDSEGRVTFVNAALRQMMRREHESLEGRTLHELVHVAPDGAESHPAARCPYTVVAHVVDADDTGFRRSDGAPLEVSYTCQPVDDADFPGSVASFRDVTARRAAGRLLQNSLQQVERLDAQRAALQENLADAEERERLRIAADIHDDTVQTLGALGLRLSRAASQAAGDSAAELLGDASAGVRDVAEQLRRLMFGLLPPERSDDLAASLRTYCSVVLADEEMQAEIVGEAPLLSAERQLLVYRLVQEAVRNAVKHSGGTRIRIELATDGAELLARVSDDGRGIDPGACAERTHAGLWLVRRRAEAGGGAVTVGSGIDGRGAAIELRLPIHEDPGSDDERG